MNEFDAWNHLKQKINKQEKTVFCKERDIFFIHLGKNIGQEQNGKGSLFKRPVIIMKQITRKIFLVIPLTTKPKKNSYDIFIGIIKNKPNWALISQIRVIDKKRLLNKIGMLNKKHHQDIAQNIINKITPSKTDGGSRRKRNTKMVI